MHWLIIVYETWESLANKLLTSEESGKSRNQNKVNPDQVNTSKPKSKSKSVQKKAISMMQAFFLLILIFSIIDTG